MLAEAVNSVTFHFAGRKEWWKLQPTVSLGKVNQSMHRMYGNIQSITLLVQTHTY